MTVHVKGDLTRSMKPGDHVVITGVYLPQPVMRRGRMFATTLLQTTVLHATAVDQLKESYTEHVVTDEVRNSCQTSRLLCSFVHKELVLPVVFATFFFAAMLQQDSFSGDAWLCQQHYNISP